MKKTNFAEKNILEKVKDAKEPNIAENTKYIENTFKNILDKFTQIDDITKELKLNIVNFKIQEEKTKELGNKIESKTPSFRIEVDENSKNNQKNNNENYLSR